MATNQAGMSWHADGVDRTNVVRFSEERLPATLETMTSLQIVTDAANEMEGADFLWIELRDADELAFGRFAAA